MRPGRLFTGLLLLAVLLAFAAGRGRADDTSGHGQPHKEGDKSADAPGDKPHGEVAAVEGEKPNIFKGFIDLSIWSIVIFLVLLFVLKKYAWGPMLEGLENREKRIHGELEQAQKANAEAQALRAEFEKKIHEAQQEVRDLIDRARKDGEQLKADMLSQATAQIQAEKERARRELQLEKEQVLMELYQRTTQLASLVSAKAIRRQLTIDDQHRLVDEALNDLGVAANERRRVLASIQ